jgi:hypothetical protein
MGYSSSAMLHFGSQVQMAFAELTGDANTSSGTSTVTVTKIQNVAVSAPYGTAGNKVQLTPGGTIIGTDVAAYDGSGNVGDSGMLLSSLEHVLFTQFSISDSKSCSTTEADFSTNYTLPAMYLTANKLLRVTIGFSLTSSASPPGMAFNLKLGGTPVYTATQTAPPASLAASPGGITFYIQGTTTPGASVSVHIHPILPPTVNGTASVPFDGPTITQPVTTVATNGTLAIKAGLICSTTSGTNGMTLNQMIVEALN